MVFSLLQQQVKCREQIQSLYLALIDLTKAFELVSTDGLFKILPLISCPLRIIIIVRSFHDSMICTAVQFDGDMYSEFGVKSGVKYGCVLAPTLFYLTSLKHAFKSSTDGVYLHNRSDGRLLNISRFRAKTKTRTVTIRDAGSQH